MPENSGGAIAACAAKLAAAGPTAPPVSLFDSARAAYGFLGSSAFLQQGLVQPAGHFLQQGLSQPAPQHFPRQPTFEEAMANAAAIPTTSVVRVRNQLRFITGSPVGKLRFRRPHHRGRSGGSVPSYSPGAGHASFG